MKLITTFLVAVGMLVSQAMYVQGADLPQNVKSDLESALKATDPTDAKAVNKVVQAAIEKNPSLAAEIVAAAVSSIGQALINNPEAAQNVIPAFVLAAAKESPALRSAILSAAIGAVPGPLQSPVIPKIVGEMVAQAGDAKGRAELLNTALQAIGDNPALLAQLDKIASDNKVSVSNSDGSDNAVRYFVDGQVAEASFTGVQGPTNAGATGGFGGSGGGSGTSSSNNDAEPVPAS